MARTFSTFLMFDGTAEEAMNRCTSAFRGASIKQIERFGPDRFILMGEYR